MNSDSAKLVVFPPDALLAHRVGYFGDDELFEWATEYAAKHPELDRESAIFKLLWLNPKMANREDNRLEALISAGVDQARIIGNVGESRDSVRLVFR